ncbi:MAG: response regulator [Candidatus Competibacteraceae bacterium]|uniref:Response regulator receiver protein n=1 Tax=Candidatus Contendobacter odensis Run_B_J11 TaxID=1400861 RepID=A0A7U7GEM4_9GAMM
MAKILIIEDDDPFREMLAEMLDQVGHQVEMAANGILGMERFRSGEPDLVITDILMPEKDGIETIIEMKRERDSIKIIAMSGGRRAITPQFNLDSAALIGVQQTLTKPFTRQQLLQAIEDTLEGVAPASRR